MNTVSNGEAFLDSGVLSPDEIDLLTDNNLYFGDLSDEKRTFLLTQVIDEHEALLDGEIDAERDRRYTHAFLGSILGLVSVGAMKVRPQGAQNENLLVSYDDVYNQFFLINVPKLAATLMPEKENEDGASAITKVINRAWGAAGVYAWSNGSTAVKYPRNFRAQTAARRLMWANDASFDGLSNDEVFETVSDCFYDKQKRLKDPEKDLTAVGRRLMAYAQAAQPSDERVLEDAIWSLEDDLGDDELVDDVSLDAIDLSVDEEMEAVIPRVDAAVEFNKLPWQMLTKPQLRVVALRFSWNTEEKRTYDVIGKNLGTTRQAVELQYNAALRILRDPEAYVEAERNGRRPRSRVFIDYALFKEGVDVIKAEAHVVRSLGNGSFARKAVSNPEEFFAELKLTEKSYLMALSHGIDRVKLRSTYGLSEKRCTIIERSIVDKIKAHSQDGQSQTQSD